MKGIKPERKPDPSGTGKMVEEYWGPSIKVRSSAVLKPNINQAPLPLLFPGPLPHPLPSSNLLTLPTRQLLSDMSFLESLKSYDKDNIPPRIMKVIRDKYTSNPDFNPKIIASVSSAAQGLCSWVSAMNRLNQEILVPDWLITSHVT